LMFQIGVFPLVMIGATLIFFSEAWHERLWTAGYWTLDLGRWTALNRIQDRKTNLQAFNSPRSKAQRLTSNVQRPTSNSPTSNSPTSNSLTSNVSIALLFLHFAFQLLFPWRYLLYPGNLFWTEEGYRFSWRVMLMEKAGTATFFVKDAKTGREGEVLNGEFLNPHQEKQMAMQPDLILQFAHFLKQHYEKKGVSDPSVRAEVYVTLNARPSQLLIDPTMDLTKLSDGWSHKTWITQNTSK